MAKELLFSVPSADLKMQSFTVGGAGGQGRDHVNTGVRFTHAPSGAVGESREYREQVRNRRAALEKLTKHPKFTFWVHERVQEIDGKLNTSERVAEEMTHLDHFKFEVKDEDGVWVREDAAAR